MAKNNIYAVIDTNVIVSALISSNDHHPPFVRICNLFVRIYNPNEIE